MLRFTVFTVLAAVAMLTEASPGGGYYSRKSYKKPVPCSNNLVDVAVSLKDDGFSTLVDLVVKLGLVDALKNIKAATVFAPTDAAFDAIADFLTTLTKAQKQLLKSSTNHRSLSTKPSFNSLHDDKPYDMKYVC